MDRASLRTLSHDDLISLILAQVVAQQNAPNATLNATIDRLEKRIAELEEKLETRKTFSVYAVMVIH